MKREGITVRRLYVPTSLYERIRDHCQQMGYKLAMRESQIYEDAVREYLNLHEDTPEFAERKKRIAAMVEQQDRRREGR